MAYGSPGREHWKEHLADATENGSEGASVEARGHERISAVTRARGGDSVHSGCDHSYHTPVLGIQNVKA